MLEVGKVMIKASAAYGGGAGIALAEIIPELSYEENRRIALTDYRICAILPREFGG